MMPKSFVAPLAVSAGICATMLSASRVQAAAGAPIQFYPVRPCRVVDTRTSANAPALAGGTTRNFALVGVCGTSPTAGAVAANVTVTGPTTPGYLTLFPLGLPRPLASTINFGPGQTRANNAVLAVGSGGIVSVFAGQTSGTVHLILDVTGYFDDPANNQPPVVDAGPNQTVTLPAGANLQGTVTDDGKPAGTLTYAWSRVGGPGAVTFGTPTSLSTTATFQAGGAYVLRLTANDSQLSGSADVTITVQPDLTTWTANEWSWDGSWAPSPGDFPLAGLLDDKYFDGHAGTPILPPGRWDWNPADSDLANWRNFDTNIGHFDKLLDSQSRHYGWKLVGNTPDVDYSGPADYFEGSSGPDVMLLGKNGTISSFGQGALGDGPDVVVFRNSWSLDFRTGSSLTGALRDNDLVVGGCQNNADGSFDIRTTTIHTGPGSDRVYIRNLAASAVDLGNGAGGRTDTLDPGDAADLAVLHGNTNDFRVFGGNGNDVVVWYIDENVQTTTWLGPNFFGGGGWGDALWSDTGTDRLVLAVPTTTPIVTSTPTPAGALLVKGTSGQWIQDDPTAADPYARYCIECGVGPGGRKTVIMEYNSADNKIHTGYFYVTAFEELQVGVGPGARVYRINDVAGTVTLAADLSPFPAPKEPTAYCQ
jgi:hypothetical protein